MADWNMDAFRARPATGAGPVRGLSKAMRMVGSVTSLVLIAGLAHWGYKLAMRQIHGIPVIHALEGPARVAPDNPGGELADYQGMAVNAIAAIGEAAPTADRLMLAPPSSNLADADVASEALQASDGTPLAAPAEPVVPKPVQPSDVMAALRPADGLLSEPLPDGPVDPIDDPELATVEAGTTYAPDELVPSDVPGVAQSPYPLPRPVGDVVAEAAAAAVAAAMAPTAPVDLDPAGLQPGTELVQIGSYETEAEAKLQWDQTVARYGALMDGKRRVVQQAESGGRVFFRLRVEGFADRDEASRFCAVLKSGGQCVPAPVRG